MPSVFSDAVSISGSPSVTSRSSRTTERAARRKIFFFPARWACALPVCEGLHGRLFGGRIQRIFFPCYHQERRHELGEPQLLRCNTINGLRNQENGIELLGIAKWAKKSREWDRIIRNSAKKR
jgi:hypothetical protein